MKIYLASPMTIYGTTEQKQYEEYVKNTYPAAQYLIADGMFRSSSDWIARWPRILADIDLLTFTHDGNGFIGKGVWKEQDDAKKHDIPVLFYSNGHFYEDFAIRLHNSGASWVKYASVKPIRV